MNTDTLKQAVVAALLEAGGDIGENLQVEMADNVSLNDGEARVDFNLAAIETVDADVALDIVEAVEGVSRSVFRREGKSVLGTVTGP